MFQSYICKSLTYKDCKHIWKYELTDSEFGTVAGIGVITIVGVIEFEIAVIQEYSKRNLNVAANLALAFLWYNKQHSYWSVQKLIDHNKIYNSLFSRYEKDLQKYLVLL
jgi:hypothetical protein